MSFDTANERLMREKGPFAHAPEMIFALSLRGGRERKEGDIITTKMMLLARLSAQTLTRVCDDDTIKRCEAFVCINRLIL